MAQKFKIVFDPKDYGFRNFDDFNETFRDGTYYIDEKEDHPALMKALSEKTKAENPNIKRGDIVEIEINPYGIKLSQNRNKLIWDGEKLLHLEIGLEFDDIGHMPREFVVSDSEFSPDWWENAMPYSVFWLSKEIRERAAKNIKIENGKYMAMVRIGDKDYQLCNNESKEGIEHYKQKLLNVEIPFRICDEFDIEFDFGLKPDDYQNKECIWICLYGCI